MTLSRFMTADQKPVMITGPILSSPYRSIHVWVESPVSCFIEIGMWVQHPVCHELQIEIRCFGVAQLRRQAQPNRIAVAKIFRVEPAADFKNRRIGLFVPVDSVFGICVIELRLRQPSAPLNSAPTDRWLLSSPYCRPEIAKSRSSRTATVSAGCC